MILLVENFFYSAEKQLYGFYFLFIFFHRRRKSEILLSACIIRFSAHSENCVWCVCTQRVVLLMCCVKERSRAAFDV